MHKTDVRTWSKEIASASGREPVGQALNHHNLEHVKLSTAATRIEDEVVVPKTSQTISPTTSFDEPNRQQSFFSWSVSDLSPQDPHTKQMQAPESVEDFTEDSHSVQSQHSHNETPYSGIGGWLKSIPDGEKNSVLSLISKDPSSHRCDIDPITGTLTEAIKYPETCVNQDNCSSQDPELAKNQLNMTSNLHIQREMVSRARLGMVIQEQRRLKKPPTPVEPEVVWPAANCTLRPVIPDDFEQIASIINAEVRDSETPQIFESKNVTVSDIQRTFQACEANKRPFIVAVSANNDLLDRSKWPAGADAAYEEYLKFRNAQRVEPVSILGFAFVTDIRIGFLRSPCPGSRHSCQVKMAVDPKHRHKGYGTTLLDRILLSVAAFHRSVIDYSWQCEDANQIYEEPSAAYNFRQYSHVFFERFVKGRADDQPDWCSKWLSQFNFQRTAQFQEIVKIKRGQDSECLDMELWALKVQPLANIAS
jgi:GNAT superfamily N-acetyltransferase